MMNDKEIERERYDSRAQSLLLEDANESVVRSNAEVLPADLYAPYKCFYTQIQKYAIAKNCTILEVGSGSGLHTGGLLATGALVTATDISEMSLKLLQKRFDSVDSLITKVADMESLPFEDESFDIVVSAGSLSYGDNGIVMEEVYRVLREGGAFIAVDSLNHNPVYRLNRWIHYLRGNRTLSTLKRMPTISMIESYGRKFGATEVHFFGMISWLVPVLTKCFGDLKGAAISNLADRVLRVRKSAFKFVMVVIKEGE